LHELVAADAQPAVSIYLPIYVATREVRQDRIRLKNLLAAAADRLAANHRKPEIDTLLSPGGIRVEDDAFWRNQRHEQHGLAVFLAQGFERVHQLPIEVPEEVIVGSHFHIKPLLPLLDDIGPFWLLTISAAHARLYQGSRWNFAEVGRLDLPQGVAMVKAMTEYEETHYARPVGRRGGSPRRNLSATIRTRSARRNCSNCCTRSRRGSSP
jgi:hypothetical protein